MIIRVLTALCAFSLSVLPVSAQSRPSDPLNAAQQSWMCRSMVTGAEWTTTNPWESRPWATPAPADYMTWSNALASQAAWAVLYGHSLWMIDREHRVAALAAMNERALVQTCRDRLGGLADSVRNAVQNDYAPSWQAAREANLARQNTPTTDPALMRKEAAWCVEAFEFGLQALDSDPKGYFQIDVNAPGSGERWERFRSAFDDQWAWWSERTAQLASQPNAAAPRSDQKFLFEEILALFAHSGLAANEIAVVRSHFAKQETNFCAAKARALQQATR